MPVAAATKNQLWIGLFGVTDANLKGPSGAIWMNVVDPNNSNYLLGGLCIAYSFPISNIANQSCQVAFNQVLKTFFDNFNSGPSALTGTATLPAQGSYPALTASCGLSGGSGDVNMIAVSLYVASS